MDVYDTDSCAAEDQESLVRQVDVEVRVEPAIAVQVSVAGWPPGWTP
jgi:hypothetical protein